jgi:large subunit ribosomal protein L29
MQVTEIRTLTTEEIYTRLDEAYQSLFRLRFDWASGQLEDNNRIRAVKRDIARLKTILREREIADEIRATSVAATGAEDDVATAS